MKSRIGGSRWRASSSRGDAAGHQQLVDQIVHAGARLGARAASARAGR